MEFGGLPRNIKHRIASMLKLKNQMKLGASSKAARELVHNVSPVTRLLLHKNPVGDITADDVRMPTRILKYFESVMSMMKERRLFANMHIPAKRDRLHTQIIRRAREYDIPRETIDIALDQGLVKITVSVATPTKYKLRFHMRSHRYYVPPQVKVYFIGPGYEYYLLGSHIHEEDHSDIYNKNYNMELFNSNLYPYVHVKSVKPTEKELRSILTVVKIAREVAKQWGKTSFDAIEVSDEQPLLEVLLKREMFRVNP